MPVQAIRKELDAEHNILDEKLTAVARLCPEGNARLDCRGCTYAPTQSCNILAQDLVADLLSYMVSHFHQEEALMHEWGLMLSQRSACEEHMEAHGDIAQAFGELAKSLTGDYPLSQVQTLQILLKAWLENHMSKHDEVLLTHMLVSI